MKRISDKTIKSIVFIGKRWFERTNGNTYHSTQVVVNGKSIGFVPFAYGYGDSWWQNTGIEILNKAGYFLPTKKQNNSYYRFIEWHRYGKGNREKVTFAVSDVARKRDLK